MSDQPFTDSTPMPWGKHKGVALANVPDSYLLWIWESFLPSTRASNKQLFKYIADNLDAIKANIKRNG